MVGDIRPCELTILGGHRGILRPIRQGQQHSGPRWVDHGPAQPVHPLESRVTGQHLLNHTVLAE